MRERETPPDVEQTTVTNGNDAAEKRPDQAFGPEVRSANRRYFWGGYLLIAVYVAIGVAAYTQFN